MELKKVMLSLGVGILSALFIGFLIDAIYPGPEYTDYCGRQFETPAIAKQVTTQGLCNYTYDTAFIANCTNGSGMIRDEYDAHGCIVKETCDYCEKEFLEVSERYNRNLFYITAPIGLVLILIGLYLPGSIDAIAGGSLLGGILTMIQITMRIFGNLSKWPRVVLLGLELVIVVWIGIKKVYAGLIAKKTKK